MSDNQLIATEESLLVIIDMQERLVPAMAEAEKLMGNVNRLLGLATVMGLPVIVTEQEKLGRTVTEIGEKITSPGPISKTAFNCFLAEGFAARLEETARNTLIIAGIEAHICVAQTALFGHPRFRVQVVGDAVASRSPENVAFALDRMRAAGVTITSTEMVIYELLRKAGTPEFKAMLPLIK
jgi:nicotinamidase-related amidase